MTSTGTKRPRDRSAHSIPHTGSGKDRVDWGRLSTTAVPGIMGRLCRRWWYQHSGILD